MGIEEIWGKNIQKEEDGLRLYEDLLLGSLF